MDGVQMRWGLAGLAAILGIVACLVAPTALAGTPSAATTVTSPYAHTSRIVQSFNDTYGCASAQQPTPTWERSGSGRGGFAGMASAQSCPASTGSDADVLGSTAVYLPLNSSLSGSHLSAHVQFQIAGQWNVTVGRCPFNGSAYASCGALASISIGGGLVLFDMTAHRTYVGKQFYESLGYTWLETCQYSNCTVYTTNTTSSGVVTPTTFSEDFILNQPMNSSHSYVLDFGVYVSAGAEAAGGVYNVSGSKGFASIAAQWDLLSYSVT